MKTFKEVIATDIKNTFLNLKEFGETHIVNRKEMTILIDENEAIERQDRMSFNTDGIYKKQLLIYVSGEEYGKLPEVEEFILVDGKSYRVADAANEEGIYSITLEVNGNVRGRR